MQRFLQNFAHDGAISYKKDRKMPTNGAKPTSQLTKLVGLCSLAVLYQFLKSWPNLLLPILRRHCKTIRQ